MHCSSTTAAEPACLGIMPGAACALSCTQTCALSHQTCRGGGATVQDIVGQQMCDANLAFFAAAQVTIDPVHDAAGFGDNLHVQTRSMLSEMGDAGLGNQPMHALCPRLSRMPGALRRPAPDTGRHNEEILTFRRLRTIRSTFGTSGGDLQAGCCRFMPCWRLT